jgi:hypothetical protein
MDFVAALQAGDRLWGHFTQASSLGFNIKGFQPNFWKTGPISAQTSLGHCPRPRNH